MIKKIIQNLFGKSGASSKARFGKRRVIAASTHGIDPDLVDERAWNVVRTLQERGFEAYIVGGAVRDLLVGLKPKDFDVATDATPEEVKACFRRAFIIGRRFRIVHVVYGRGRDHEVIEVSTFRAHLDSNDAEQVSGNERTSKKALSNMTHAVDASGRVLRDNVWGPQDEDATRRDFTVNAMYYDPSVGEVIDYHHGFEDAAKRVIRMIGEPAARYREDPVRIIRAVRFSAKLNALGFKLEPRTAKPLKAMMELLADVREGWQARLADMPVFPALQEAMEEVFNARIGDVSGRGKLAGDMREIWSMQPRFEKRSGSAPFGLVEQARFRAGFDFMCLRAEVGEVDVELADGWEDFSLADDESRVALLQAVKPAPRAVRGEGEAKKRPRRRRKPAGAKPDAGGHTDA